MRGVKRKRQRKVYVLGCECLSTLLKKIKDNHANEMNKGSTIRHNAERNFSVVSTFILSNDAIPTL